MSTGTMLRALSLALIVPAFAQAGISVIGELTRDHDVASGGRADGALVLSNNGAASEVVKLYQTDYLFFSDGRNLFGEPAGRVPRSNGSWLTLDRDRVEVPPGGTASVGYAIRVPVGTERVGTYWSVVMVESLPHDSPEIAARAHGRATIELKVGIRRAIQVITNFGSTGRGQLQIRNKDLIEREGKQALQIGVANDGERVLRPDASLELWSPKGAQVAKVLGGTLRTYPGTSVNFRFDLSKVPRGTYKAMLILDCGGNDVFGANYDLTLGPR